MGLKIKERKEKLLCERNPIIYVSSQVVTRSSTYAIHLYEVAKQNKICTIQTKENIIKETINFVDQISFLIRCKKPI
jgi:hypothetical protein